MRFFDLRGQVELPGDLGHFLNSFEQSVEFELSDCFQSHHESRQAEGVVFDFGSFHFLPAFVATVTDGEDASRLPDRGRLDQEVTRNMDKARVADRLKEKAFDGLSLPNRIDRHEELVRLDFIVASLATNRHDLPPLENVCVRVSWKDRLVNSLLVVFLRSVSVQIQQTQNKKCGRGCRGNHAVET